MSIAVPAGAVYMPCYSADPSTGSAKLGKYNYTEALQKMTSSTPPEGITYWGEPDEYGRVYVDPNHPCVGTLEPARSADYSGVQLPDVPYRLPFGDKTEEKSEKEEERKAQAEQLRLLREERERTARQEALLHRLAQSVLAAKRG